MSDTGSDSTRPPTTDTDSENARTRDTPLATANSTADAMADSALLPSTEFPSTTTVDGIKADDALLGSTEPQTASYVNADMQEESLLGWPEHRVTDISSDDAQNPRTEKTKHLNLAKRAWRQVNDTHHGRFTRLDFLLGIVSIILYIVDFGSDVQLAITYFLDGHVVYGGLTTAFIVLAYIVVFLGGLGQFVKNSDVPTAWWVCRIIFLILGLSPVTLTVEYMHYGLRSRARRREGERDGEEDGGDDEELYKATAFFTLLLRLFESFLEAAPQLCFQLYVTFKEKPRDVTTETLRGVAILSSWAVLAVMAVKVADTGEKAEKDKPKFSSKLVYFLWRVCETGGRVLCIALFASTFEFSVFGVVGFHFVVMFVWLVWVTLENEGAVGAAVFGMVYGYIMVFYMPFHSRPSRYLYLVYYALFYTENFLMLALWAVMTSDRDAWFYIPAIVTVIVLFLLHIVTQLLYYKCFHPKAGDIKFCVECDRGTFVKSLKEVGL